MAKTKALNIGPIIMNPGAGAIEDQTSPEAAARNMEAFAQDVRALNRIVTWEPMLPPRDDEAPLLMGGTKYQDEHDGRYPFRVFVDGVRHVVEMPGTALAEVRWMDEPGQNIWDFPRVFTDGSSWVWKFAIDFGENADLGASS